MELIKVEPLIKNTSIDNGINKFLSIDKNDDPVTIRPCVFSERLAVDKEGNIYNFFSNIQTEQLEMYKKIIEIHGSLITFGYSDIATNFKGKEMVNFVALYVKANNEKDIMNFNNALVKYLIENM